jgi:PII-like signaling protein
MRIFLGEKDRCTEGPHRGKPLWEAILLTLRDSGCAGATVTRAVAGFGASSHLHSDKVLRLSSDLPIVVEAVDTEQALQELLPTIDELMGGGLITLEKARVVLHRPGPEAGEG